MKMLFPALLVVILLVAACTPTVYVCYDGTTQEDASKCPVLATPKILQRDAERVADNYGGAYALAKNSRYTRVNTYKDEANWNVNVLFTDAKSGNVVQVTFQVNGTTQTVSCIDGCDYLNTTQNITNTTTQ